MSILSTTHSGACKEAEHFIDEVMHGNGYVKYINNEPVIVVCPDSKYASVYIDGQKLHNKIMFDPSAAYSTCYLYNFTDESLQDKIPFSMYSASIGLHLHLSRSILRNYDSIRKYKFENISGCAINISPEHTDYDKLNENNIVYQYT